jgi:transcription initiation factor TFIIIB Brf1 subunit/transcription initiation factor TFIIB
MSQICPDCGSKNIDRQDASGQMVCTNCGTLLEENALCSALEFVEGAGGASSMVGQFVSNTSSKAYTPGRNVYAISRDSRETTLAKGRQKIQEVASRLRLGGHFVDAAHRYFTIAVEKNFVQGRQTIHVVAACLYIACRQEKSQHMLIDFSDALQVNVYTLGTCFLKFRRLLGLKLAILDPALYVYRFAAHLDLDDKANAVALTALRLVGRMKRDWIVAGRRPAGICAAALLIAARAHGFARDPQDVTRILRVCGLTVSTRVREFEQTPSASLTLDQFNRVELETEADPPVYTRNKIREARARAIQKNDIKLLNSGALDDKMKGKRAAKWRLQKVKQKHLQFEKLYQSIQDEMIRQDGGREKEATTTKAAPAPAADKDTAGETTAESTTNNNTTTMDKETLPLPQGKDADGDDDDDDDDLNKKPAAIDKAATTTTTTTTAIATKEDKAPIPMEWKQAYPKGKYGKAMMLPEHATPEELEPSSIFVEGKLHTVVWKESMPQEMVQDVDSIFRNPREIAEKDAIFNKINKDYIELHAQKEKHRSTQEQTQTHNDKEMEEQEKGHDRYRKRKTRGKDPPETTEDALLQAVATRKISRKINYDAMSAIFDDDGTFSTDAAARGAGAFEDENEAAMPEL